MGIQLLDWGGSPTKIDRDKGILIRTSLLEDLVVALRTVDTLMDDSVRPEVRTSIEELRPDVRLVAVSKFIPKAWERRWASHVSASLESSHFV